MSILTALIDLALHLDTHLASIIATYGILAYVILFIIIFAETGLVFTPFLPGDSLLFVAGTLAATGSLNIALLIGILCIAAILGDSVNYAVGKYLGLKLFKRYPKLLKKEYLDKTHAFYEKHGGKTIVFARFFPIVRTFAPFVAGVGLMKYKKFITYNVVGGITWVFLFCLAGYYFGSIRLVKDNLTLAILAVMIATTIPVIVEYIKHHRRKGRSKSS